MGCAVTLNNGGLQVTLDVTDISLFATRSSSLVAGEDWSV